jgi:hypothetical protein
MQVQLPILTNNDCKYKYGQLVDTNAQLCAGIDGGDKDTCQVS